MEGLHAPHRPCRGFAVVERRCRARRRLQDLRQRRPRQQAIAYTKRGVAFRIRGGLQRALADLNRAIELDPSLAPIYANRGLVYMYLGESDPALADFNRALELDPKNPLSTSTAAPSINA